MGNARTHPRDGLRGNVSAQESRDVADVVFLAHGALEDVLVDTVQQEVFGLLEGI